MLPARFSVWVQNRSCRVSVSFLDGLNSFALLLFWGVSNFGNMLFGDLTSPGRTDSLNPGEAMSASFRESTKCSARFTVCSPTPNSSAIFTSIPPGEVDQSCMIPSFKEIFS